MSRRLTEDGGNIGGSQATELPGSPRAAARPRMLGERARDRHRAGVALRQLEGGKPARAEVDGVEDEHVARHLLRLAVQEVKAGVEALARAGVAQGARVDLHPA